MAVHLGCGLVQSEHDGKMLNIPSISTSCLRNPRCIARMKAGDSVCSKCYAAAYMAFRKGLADAMERNFDILNDHVLSDEELEGIGIKFTPKMEAGNPRHYARIESFGDSASVTHARNHLRIIKRNGLLRWGLWTKNDDHYGEALEIEGKPENLSLGYSSPKLNEVADIEKLHPVFRSNMDFVFTVFEDWYIEKHGIIINCGARACAPCGACYEANQPDADGIHRVKYINERKK